MTKKRKPLWPPGPWFNEPDRDMWREKVSGYQCLIVRHQRMGHLCGYVGLPAEHPYCEKYYDNLPAAVDDASHVEITFAGYRTDVDDESLWWLGFNCAHAYDVVPAINYTVEFGKCVYRDFEYVKSVCERLALALYGLREDRE